MLPEHQAPAPQIPAPNPHHRPQCPPRAPSCPQNQFCVRNIIILHVFGPVYEAARRNKHEIWRYWRVQIPYGDPIGDQNDEWSKLSQ